MTTTQLISSLVNNRSEVTMDRDDFIAAQRAYLDEMFSFAPRENEARKQFEQLAVKTYDCLSTAGRPPYSRFAITPDAYSNFVNQTLLHPLVPPSLLNQWQDWASSYINLSERNSRLVLYDMMQLIGETNLFESWPYGFEHLIQDWLDSGIFEPIPFDDRTGVVNLDFYQRLQAARIQSNGWLYWDNVTKKSSSRLRTIGSACAQNERRRNNDARACEAHERAGFQCTFGVLLSSVEAHIRSYGAAACSDCRVGMASSDPRDKEGPMLLNAQRRNSLALSICGDF